MYQKKIWRFNRVIEVEEYHSARYGAPGEKRREKVKATPEMMAAANQRNRERTCRHKLLQYFDVGDYYITLTYRREERPPDLDTCKAHFAKMIRELRKEYRKAGEELRWIRNIECGTRGAWHIHMAIKRIPDIDLLIAKAWPYGSSRIELMHLRGGFSKLAAYITKTPKTDNRICGSNYSTSRNMPLKPPELKTYLHWKTWTRDEAGMPKRIPEGWQLDPESLLEGINPLTGYPFRRYRLIRAATRKMEKYIQRPPDRGKAGKGVK